MCSIIHQSVRLYWYTQVEVKTLTEHLESTKQELASKKQKAHLMEQQLVQARTGATSAGMTRSPSSGRGASSVADGVGVGGVSEVLAEKVATLEMKEMSERQRAELATVR